MLATELTLARSGALDGDLQRPAAVLRHRLHQAAAVPRGRRVLRQPGQRENLTGDQWGVMNETGSYPGQPWLWLYQLWYHVPGWGNSFNLDLIAIYMTGLGDAAAAVRAVHPRAARHSRGSSRCTG